MSACHMFFRGNNHMKHCILNKPTKFGITLWHSMITLDQACRFDWSHYIATSFSFVQELPSQLILRLLLWKYFLRNVANLECNTVSTIITNYLKQCQKEVYDKETVRHIDTKLGIVSCLKHPYSQFFHVGLHSYNHIFLITYFASTNISIIELFR